MAKFVSQQINDELIEAFKRNKYEISRALMDIREMLKQQKNYDISLMQGVEALIKHEKNGGSITTIGIPYDSNANSMFSDLLKKSGVPFFSIGAKNPDKEVFFTRDIDKRVIDLCRRYVENRLLYATGELTAENLFKRFPDEKILIKRDFDKADIEVFRREAGKNNSYALVEDFNDPEKYMLLYPESKLDSIEKAIDKTIFTLSGKDGIRTREQLNRALDEKKKFLQTIEDTLASGKTAYIADSINPSRYISINENGVLIFHETKLIENTDGKKELVDEHIKTDKFKSLTAYIDKLINPVILLEREFDLLNSQAETFQEDVELMKLKLMIFPDKRRYASDERIERILKPLYQNFTLYRDLPEEIIEKLEKYIKENGFVNAAIQNGYLACMESDKPYIDKFLEENLYETYIPDDNPQLKPFIRYESKFYHEGRGHLNLTDFENMDRQYVVDLNNPGFVFGLSEYGLTIYEGFPKDGKVTVVEDQDIEKTEDNTYIRDPNFDSDILRLFNCFTEPVVITDTEMDSLSDKSEFNRLLEEKRYELIQCEYTDDLISAVFMNDNSSFTQMLSGESVILNDKQKDAIEKIREYKADRETVQENGTIESFKDIRQPEIEIEGEDISIS